MSKLSVQRVFALLGCVMAVGCGKGCREAGLPASPPTESQLAGLGLAGGPGCPFDAVVVGGLSSNFDCSSLDGPGFPASQLGVSGGLGGFCRVGIPPGAVARGIRMAEIEAELRPRLPPEGQVSPDCVVLQPLLGSGGGGSARDAALDRIGRPKVAAGTELEAAVQVVVLGDAATATGTTWTRVDGSSGAEIGALIQDLVCPPESGGCVARVSSERALTRTDARAPRAPARGSFSELAEAIDRAMEAAPAALHTVLHLTAGWAADGASELTHPLRGGSVGTQLVLRALQVASCRGALSVASVAPDFRTPTSGSSGLIYPAAWSTVVRPERERCLEWLSPERLPDGLETVPLVFTAAASRVPRDAEGGGARPFSTLRAEAVPTYFAIGSLPPRRGAPIVSGAPTAAAALTAALAWGWWLLPEGEDEAQLTRELARSGARMSRALKVTLPSAVTPGASQARLLRPCQLIEASCGRERCPSCPEFPPPRAWEEEGAASPLVPVPEGRRCSEQLRVTVFASADVAIEPYCAERFDAFQHPWARPAASSGGCRRCEGRAVVGASVVELRIELADEAPRPDFVVFSNGRSHALHSVAGWGLAPGKSAFVRLELPGPVPSGLEARLFFSDGGVTSAEPVELWP